MLSWSRLQSASNSWGLWSRSNSSMAYRVSHYQNAQTNETSKKNSKKRRGRKKNRPKVTMQIDKSTCLSYNLRENTFGYKSVPTNAFRNLWMKWSGALLSTSLLKFNQRILSISTPKMPCSMRNSNGSFSKKVFQKTTMISNKNSKNQFRELQSDRFSEALCAPVLEMQR